MIAYVSIEATGTTQDILISRITIGVISELYKSFVSNGALCGRRTWRRTRV